MADDDNEALTPSHGHGTVMPFKKGSPRAKAASEAGVAARRRNSAERKEAARKARLVDLADADARRQVAQELRALGIVDARAVMDEMRGDPMVLRTLGRAVAIDSLARIISGEFPIKDAAMAARVAETGLRLARLEEGVATEIVEDDSERVQRIRDAARAAGRHRTG